MASSGVLRIKIVGDSKPFEKTMSGLGGVAKKGMAALAGVGLAAGAAAAKGIADFGSFEGKMNEVFTLLPGISDRAMSDMEGQVKNFSREFGVLPDEVVPALYQSLSAGVPKDNVFEFMETAQQAAKGGVTDLTTAVDGISSVVNAYGDDVVNAAEASDLMFTAVRLGKTNFEELSSTLSNVTPIASGLGVKFEDLTAGLATLTAKGTPTAQATTQLRSLFVELSKAGGETAGVFEEMAGKSFQEFIAEGGNTADALGIMQQAADDSGVEIQDLFSSVEAGSAALSLTSGEAFTDNLNEMGDAAGATGEAFDRMETGIGPVFEKLKANAAVAFLEIGDALAPTVEAVGNFVIDSLPKLSAWWSENSPAIIGAAQALFEGIRSAMEQIGAVVDAVRPTFERIVEVIRNNLLPVAAGIAAVLVPAFVAWAASAAAAAAATLVAAAPAIALGAAVAALAAGVVWAYQNFEAFRNIVDAVAQFIMTTVWPMIQQFADFIVAKFGELVGWVQSHWGAIREAISHVVNVIAGVIRTVIDVVSALWRAWGDDLMNMVRTTWDFIAKTVTNAINAVKSIIEAVLHAINGDWGMAWNAIKDLLSTLWDQMVNVVTTAFELVGSIIGGVLSTIQEVWRGAWDTVKGVLSAVWDAIVTTVEDKIDAVLSALGGIVDYVRDLPGRIASAAAGMWDSISSGFRSMINNVIGWWNRLSFTIPAIDVPGPFNFAGATVSTPNIPFVHQGGTFRAPRPGGEGLAMLRDGERVSTPTSPSAPATVRLDEDQLRRLARMVVQISRAA